MVCRSCGRAMLTAQATNANPESSRDWSAYTTLLALNLLVTTLLYVTAMLQSLAPAPSTPAEAYFHRGRLRQAGGDLEGALSDMLEAQRLDSIESKYGKQIDAIRRAGK